MRIVVRCNRIMTPFVVFLLIGGGHVSYGREIGSPAIKTNLQVETAGTGTYGDMAVAQPADAVNLMVYLENTGHQTGKRPRISITLDPRLVYVSNSSILSLKKSNQERHYDLSDRAMLFTGRTITWGFTDREPQPDDGLYLEFKARLGPATSFALGKTELRLTALAQFDELSPTVAPIVGETNTVIIIVNRLQKPVPAFTLRAEMRNATLRNPQWAEHRPISAAPGHTVVYRLTVVNTGNVEAHNVGLRVTLPPAITPTGEVVLYSKDHRQGVPVPHYDITRNGYVIPVLAPGTSKYEAIEFAGTVADPFSGALSTHSEYDAVSESRAIYQGRTVAQARSRVTISSKHQLLVTTQVLDPLDNSFKHHREVASKSEPLTYRILIQNNGVDVTRGPVLHVFLPDKMEYVNGTLIINGQYARESVSQAVFHHGVRFTGTSGMTQEVIFKGRLSKAASDTETVTIRASLDTEGPPVISDSVIVTLR